MHTDIEGRVKLTARSDGFVRIAKEYLGKLGKVKDGESVLIPHEFLNRALDRDQVRVEIVGKKLDERSGENILWGKVSEILERNKYAYAGILKEEDGKYVVIPDDKKSYITFEIESKPIAKVGDKVVVEILNWEDVAQNPTGKIIKDLGNPKDNNAEMLAFALERGFSDEHDAEVKEEADVLYKRGITEEDKQPGDGVNGRRDFREILTFTIDPADAKDFDDAISFCELENGNYEIGIHIADVSHYLEEGMHMDEEARSRQTSVYLVDRTIPMLPEVLSNDLCSLVEGQDRLVMSAVFEMDKQAQIHKQWCGRSVIKSDKRFTYAEVEKILVNGGLYEAELREINKITKQLESSRIKQGALVIDSEEVKFELDASGVPVGVYVKERGDSNKLIEELMLLANGHVSKFIYDTEKDAETPDISVYRVDDKPDSDRMRELGAFIKSLGEQALFKDGVIPSQDLNKLTKKLDAEGRETEKDILALHIAKSMQKAVYSTNNIGHYGLALKYYSHFTSPIRRYPDVLIHRILMRVLRKNWLASEDKMELNKLCNQANRREREATEAERDSIKYKQVEYMSLQGRKIMEGIISGVTRFGVFVEEDKSKSQGMIRLANLGDDYYEFNEHKQEVVGRRTHETFKIGDKIVMKVLSANLDERQIDFERVRE